MRACWRMVAGGVFLLMGAGPPPAGAAEVPGPDRIEAIERQMQALQRELAEVKAAQRRAAEAAAEAARQRAAGEAGPQAGAAPQAEARTVPPAAGGQAASAGGTAPTGPEGPATEKPEAPFGTLFDGRVKVGAYGSFRFESNSLTDVKNTFTLRRLVFTTDANITDRLRSLVEVEYERFTNIEVDKQFTLDPEGRRAFLVTSSVEGNNGSEISLEQAWLQYELAPWARVQVGNILVPVGRFNIRHDDNLWDLPRRSLVDRGVPVLPVAAAWPELGAGLNGDVTAGSLGKFSYRAYVMNGVSLDTQTENKARFGAQESETEVEIAPARGTAALDSKGAKAVAGRLAWSPLLGQEIAASIYSGRYTPRLLNNRNLLSWSVDGLATFAGFELEAEYVNTSFGGTRTLGQELAQRTFDQEIESGTAPLNATIEFELSQLAERKSGYWVELRYPFWPDAWSKSLIGKHFDNPLLVPVLRVEQAWLKGLLGQVNFSGGLLTGVSAENRHIWRITPGIALRLTPLVRFQLAYEYTKTDTGKSLRTVTNFLPALDTEDHANALLVGVAWGF